MILKIDFLKYILLKNRKTYYLMVALKNFKEEKLDIKLPKKYEEFTPLIPKILIKTRVEFELTDCSISIANGLRRVLLSELTSYRMYLDMTKFIEHIETNDDYFLPPIFIQSLRMVPIKQSIAKLSKKSDMSDIEFRIEKKNTLGTSIKIYTGDIDIYVAGKKIPNTYFNKTTYLINLSAGKSIYVKGIRLLESTGRDFGGHRMGPLAVCLPMDIEPYNQYTGKGTRTAEANPKHHKIVFNTNDEEPPKKMIKRAISNIINRLQAVKFELSNIEVIGNEQILLINDETETIAQIIYMISAEFYPDREPIFAPIDNSNKIMRIRSLDDNLEEYLKSVIKSAVVILEKIETCI